MFASFTVGPLLCLSMYGCPGLCAKPKPERRLEYQIEPAVTDRSERARAATGVSEVMRRRLDSLGLIGASTHAHEDRISVDLPALEGIGLDDLKTVLTRRGKVEFHLVDDRDDWAGRLRASRGEGEAEPGIENRQEAVYDGPEKVRNVHFLVATKAPGESLSQARSTLESVASRVPVPPERQVAYGQLSPPSEGWRTYLLHARVELGNQRVRNARATQDPGGGTGWTVAVQFTDPGADEFEALTTNNFKRRLALVFDGEVEMAPLIQSPILGGRANLTMGAGSPASQQRQALQLAIVLNSDALPAAVIPVSEVRIP